MIIGFLGKGGSGKTTLATLWTKYLLGKDVKDVKKVYAIDNDHNMDLKYNLMNLYNKDNGGDKDMNYIGQSLQEIFEKIAISATSQVAEFEDEEYLFDIDNKDNITKKYSIDLGDRLMLAASGPSGDDILYGSKCSHSLTTPLKVYLPLLKVGNGEFVVVDEKAGTDGVGTGVTTGFNMAVVVAEATEHGVKAAKQIIHMLRFYNTPFVIVINKVRDNTNTNVLIKSFIDEFSPFYENIEDFKSKIFEFRLDEQNIDFNLSHENVMEFDRIYSIAISLNDDRLKRTKERIFKSKEYIEN